MEKFHSLADLLGVQDPRNPAAPVQPVAEAQQPIIRLEDIAGDAKAFCEAVLNSYEFRQYIVHGLILGSLPPAIMIRVMDMAGWQKPPERHEHTGKDGKPIESITEVRRVIVRSTDYEDAGQSETYTTH